MKKLGLGLISVVAAAAMLAACGGGGDANVPAKAASSNVTAPITASSVAAVKGEAFTFSSGVAKFGTTSPTTVTLDSASSFSIASTEGSASGDLGFGSCIFKVTKSTYAAGHALALGQTVTVHPCSITVSTAGLTAEANATARAVSFVLEGNASVAHNLVVDVAENGTVTVSGVTVGSVTLVPATGGSSF